MRGSRKGLAPSLHWHGSLLACLWIIWFCWLLRITSRGLYEPLQISCCSCCESLWILADHSGSFSICLSYLGRFMLIFADKIFVEVHRFESPPLPLLQVFQTFLVSMGGKVSIFPLIWFSVTVPVGNCLQKWFPLTGLPWIPPCLGLKCSGPLPTFKAPVPKLIYCQWV